MRSGWRSLLDQSWFKPSLVAITLSTALNAAAAAQPASFQLGQNDSNLLFNANSNSYARNRIMSELDKFDHELPAKTAEQVRADTERYYQISSGDNLQFVQLIGALIYLHKNQLFERPQFNPEVQKQMEALTQDVFDSLRSGMFGAIPLEQAELRELCRGSPYTSTFPAIDPYFRVPIEQGKEDEIRTTLHARLREMAKNRELLWMNAPRLSPDDRRVLWKAFIREAIDILIVDPSVAPVKEAVSKCITQDEDLARLIETKPTVTNEAIFEPPKTDKTDFDRLRTSNERV